MRKLIGIGILVVVAAVAVIATQVDWEGLQRDVPTRLSPVTLSIYYGGEKSRFLKNPEIEKILSDRYKITLQATKRGSIEMSTTDDTTGQHCIWPSNQVAVALAKRSGKTVLRDENIFNSPIVFYAWRPVTEALATAGIVEQRSGGHYVVKSRELVDMVIAGKRWKDDLGLNIYGPIRIFSTDPRKSNSGNMWSGLLANLMNGGEVATDASIGAVLPRVTSYFQSMGHMEHSSGDIFENFLKQGMGSRPIIVGYENQLPEFILEHPDYKTLIQNKITILYPEPTVFSSHPLISLKAPCKRLEEALKDKEVQDIAWRMHGFRTGLLGVTNDPSVLGATGIPESVDLVIPMPDASVMSRIIQSLN